MNYQIIASDLDKTLLDDHHRVSPENWQAIARFQEMGVHFVPTSGRAFGEMPAELVESPLIRYYITSDGTTVYDKQTNTTHEIPLPVELGHHVLDKIYSYPVCVMIHADTNGYLDAATHSVENYVSFNMNDYWISFSMEKPVPIPNFKQFAYSLKAIQSVVVFFRNMEDLQECKAYFEQDTRLIIAQTDPYNLEIFSCKAGKGNALYLLADMLNIERTATMAVGDSTNDMTMVQAAGLGLAVENAVPELKSIADEIICDYHDHCARYILEHYFCD